MASLYNSARKGGLYKPARFQHSTEEKSWAYVHKFTKQPKQI